MGGEPFELKELDKIINEMRKPRKKIKKRKLTKKKKSKSLTLKKNKRGVKRKFSKRRTYKRLKMRSRMLVLNTKCTLNTYITIVKKLPCMHVFYLQYQHTNLLIISEVAHAGFERKDKHIKRPKCGLFMWLLY